MSIFRDWMSKIVAMWQCANWWCGLNVMNNPARLMGLWNILYCQEHHGKREVNIQCVLHSWLVPTDALCVKLGLLVGLIVGLNLISDLLHGEGCDPEGDGVNISYWTSVSFESDLLEYSWLWLNGSDWWIGSDIVISGSGLSWLPVLFSYYLNIIWRGKLIPKCLEEVVVTRYIRKMA
jgi:hypothetical protein